MTGGGVCWRVVCFVVWVLLLVDVRGCCQASGRVRSSLSLVYFGSISSMLRCPKSDVLVVVRAALVLDSIVLGRRCLRRR